VIQTKLWCGTLLDANFYVNAQQHVGFQTEQIN
jgi:hypothetical protein